MSILSKKNSPDYISWLLNWIRGLKSLESDCRQSHSGRHSQRTLNPCPIWSMHSTSTLSFIMEQTRQHLKTDWAPSQGITLATGSKASHCLLASREGKMKISWKISLPSRKEKLKIPSPYAHQLHYIWNMCLLLHNSNGTSEILNLGNLWKQSVKH